MDCSDEKFMIEALAQAEIAFHQGEVPVGAVLVHDGVVIARAYNLVERFQDATAHAEMLVLRKGAQVLGGWRLHRCTLYTTLEPCAMCAGAAIAARIDAIVWAAPDLRQGAGGSLYPILQTSHPIHNVAFRKEVLMQPAAQLLKTFFQKRRAGDTPSPVNKPSAGMVQLFDELVAMQNKKLLTLAQTMIPHLTEDDLLQPNDFPDLELHPGFRHEEGVLEGLLTSRAAYLALCKD